MILRDFDKRMGAGAALKARDIATVAALHGIDNATAEDPLGVIEPPIATLWPSDGIPRELKILAAILRVADGFDRSLRQEVAHVSVEGDAILACAEPGLGIDFNILRAQLKGALLDAVFGCSFSFLRGPAD